MDTWNWTSSSPTPQSGTRAHQSAAASGIAPALLLFRGADDVRGLGRCLYTYVYIDPANVPSELMLQWNDGTTWNHRAYWGANTINMGTDGTTSRHYMGPMPAAGQWVQLQVPASAVALEGVTVSGMAFTMYDGRVTWDNAGKGIATSSTTGGGGDHYRWETTGGTGGGTTGRTTGTTRTGSTEQ